MKQDTFIPGPREPVSLFVSDTHLFHRHNSALDIQGRMIEQIDPDRLYLVGDILDYEYLHHIAIAALEEGEDLLLPDTFEEFMEEYDVGDLEKHLRFLDLVMAKVNEGVEVHYVTGNHDNNLDYFHGETVEGVFFHDHMIEVFGDEVTHVEHGDENDPAALKNYQGLYSKGSKILDAGLATDHKLKKLFDSISPPDAHYPFPLTNGLKRVGKFFISAFRQNAATRAMDRGATATVTGHIHRADIRTLNVKNPPDPDETELTAAQVEEISERVRTVGFTYRNIGDGLTHGTSLVYEGNGMPRKQNINGWSILKQRDIVPSHTFDVTKENPYEQFRPRTMAFLQKAWESFLLCTDNDPVWDHAGTKVAEARAERYAAAHQPERENPAQGGIDIPGLEHIG